jgi:hypothetical protein
MTHTTDALAALLARLGPKGPTSTGKPARRAERYRTAGEQDPIAEPYTVRIDAGTDAEGKPVHHRPFAGALSPRRVGATSSQTRSRRIDIESETDLAGALADVRDPVTFGLLVWVAMPHWRLDLHVLEGALWGLVEDRALGRGWTDLVYVDPDDRSVLITRDPLLPVNLPRAVLQELTRADACGQCDLASGKVIDISTKPPQWVTCPACGGKGYSRLGIRKRAKALRMRYATYRTSQARTAYEWLLGDCNDRLRDAKKAIRNARGRYDDED